MNINKHVPDKSQFSENNLSGVYRAIVEDVKDPMKLARVRVRVPMLHGTKDGSNNYLPTDQLPWATPINPAGSGYDHGTCLVPEVGDLVFILFEDNDRNYPLYLGGCYGKGGTDKTYGTPEESSTYSGELWRMPLGANEVPREVYNSSGSPTGKVIYKSPKGATITIEETDGKESIRILDMLGQSIRLASAMNSGANAGNKSRRGGADAYSGKTSSSDYLYAEITATDARGQQIRMISNSLDSSIYIKSGPNGSGPKIYLEEKGATVEHNGNFIRLYDDYASIEVAEHIFKIRTDGSIDIDGSGEIIIDPEGNIRITGTHNIKVKSRELIELETSLLHAKVNDFIISPPEVS